MSQFRQPWVEVGMTVLWFAERSGSNPPSPGLVTEVHDQTITANVFDQSTIGGVPKQGIRHKNDPRLRDHVDNDAGCWDYRTIDKRTILPEIKKIEGEIEQAERERLAAQAQAQQPAKKAA